MRTYLQLLIFSLFFIACNDTITEEKKYIILLARIDKVTSYTDMTQGRTGNHVYEKIRIDYRYSYHGFKFSDYDVLDIEYAEKRKYLSLDSNDVIKIYAQKRKPKYSAIKEVFIEE